MEELQALINTPAESGLTQAELESLFEELPTKKRGHRSFDVTLALVLVILASPLLAAIAALIWLVDGRPILYRGHRLGFGKRPFNILKFRTLRPGAQQALGSQLFSNQTDLKTRTGNFLRDTRLDELPQLFNILRGDMNFIGPRPVRPEVYVDTCCGIPGYDARFETSPGLIGYSQVFTPHSTPKRLRSSLDRRVYEDGSFYEALRLIFFTAVCVLRCSTIRAVRYLHTGLWQHKILGRHQRRTLTRRRLERAEAIIARERCELVDINERSCMIRSSNPLPMGCEVDLRLRVRVGRKSGGRPVKTARCKGWVEFERGSRDVPEYVIRFEPRSENSCYIIDQYFLRKSVAWLR